MGLAQSQAGACVQLGAGGVRNRRRLLHGFAQVTDILEAGVAARVIHLG
jgi:hypothetical protein